MGFKDIIGQEAAIRILQDELLSTRIHHAYLFMGKEGVGKKSLALQFARALNCSEEEADSCGCCLSCRKIIHSNHPDVRMVEIEEGNSIGIDQVRELQRDIAFKPYESSRKIYIVDGADQMTPEAANSLLKTLEEPPDYAVIILLAEELDKLLPTVISRCQQLYLTEIPRDMIKEVILKKGLEDEKADLVSRLAEGSLGRALEIIEDEEFLSLRAQLFDFLYKLPGSDSLEIIEQADSLAGLLPGSEKDRETGFPLFDLILNWYRDIILYNQGAQEQIVNCDYLERIKSQSKIYNIKELLAIINQVNHTISQIKSNVKKDLALEVLFLKIRSKRV